MLIIAGPDQGEVISENSKINAGIILGTIRLGAGGNRVLGFGNCPLYYLLGIVYCICMKCC